MVAVNDVPRSSPSLDSDAAVLAALPDGLILVDSDGTIVRGWGQAAALLGTRNNDALAGTHTSTWIHPADLGYVADAIAEGTRRGVAHMPVVARVGAGGVWRSIEATSSGGRYDDDPNALLISLRLIEDRGITGERRSQMKSICLRMSGKLLSAHGDRIDAEIDTALAELGEFYECSALRLRYGDGSSVSWGADHTWAAGSPGTQVNGFIDHGGTATSREYEVEIEGTPGSSWFLAWDEPDPSASGWDDGFLEFLRLAGAAAVAAHERNILEDDLRRRAQYDALTGLLNRSEIETRLSTMLAGQIGVVVLFCDLDGFKVANDTHGHVVGDQVLAAVAARMNGVIREGDTLGRVGGDEFIVLCPGLEDHDIAGVIARIENVLATPILVDGSEVVVGVSVGYAVGGAGQTSTSVIAEADQAMYSVKSARPARELDRLMARADEEAETGGRQDQSQRPGT